MKKLFLIVAVLLCTFSNIAAQDNTPTFIDNDANVISLSNASDTQRQSWKRLSARMDSLEHHTSDGIVRILHIGDSHIQAEFVTNALRAMLQDVYGNAGRGLVSPLRLAGTNQPVDYVITAPDADQWRKTRLLKLPWTDTPGVTGIAAQPTQTSHVTIKALNRDHRIFRATILTSDGKDTKRYDTLQDSIRIDIRGGESLYGAILENGKPGLLYSAIGNNGACFTDYLLIPNFVKDTEVFNPDLIILSMGTNEGFSCMTDDEIQRCTADLIRLLRKTHPSAAMLILTPMECQINRNHGYRPLSPYYDINEHVADAAKLIADVAATEGIPVWDFYAIAGGHGASAKWIDANLFSKDRIHLNAAGYTLQARLMFAALRAVLRQ